MGIVEKLSTCFSRLYDEELVLLCRITEDEILCSDEFYVKDGKYDPIVFACEKIIPIDSEITSSEGRSWGDVLFRISCDMERYNDLLEKATPEEVIAAITSVYFSRIDTLAASGIN